MNVIRFLLAILLLMYMFTIGNMCLSKKRNYNEKAEILITNDGFSKEIDIAIEKAKRRQLKLNSYYWYMQNLYKSRVEDIMLKDYINLELSHYKIFNYSECYSPLIALISREAFYISYCKDYHFKRGLRKRDYETFFDCVDEKNRKHNKKLIFSNATLQRVFG